MLNTEWQLGGSAAERYETYLVPVIFTPWARDLLTRSGLGPGDRLLDLACGTGIVSRTAAAQGVRATGGDINEGMLAVARHHCPDPEVRFVPADAQALPFEDASFDAVICQQGLQFFPDKPGAVREVFRVLKPGGRAVFCTARALGENPLMSIQVTAFGDALGAPAAAPIRAVCGFPDPDTTREIFSAAGFDPVSVEKVVLMLEAPDAQSFVGGLLEATPVAGEIGAMGDAARAALADAILQGFSDHRDGAGLRFPHSANVVLAERPRPSS